MADRDRRAARRAERTSDVTRFRGLVAGTVAAAAAVVAAALLLPPPGGHGAPGPLSRPHARANLGCDACHGTSAAPRNADTSCAGCHGPHPSLRAGHARLQTSGALRCSTCHPIHRADQGVALAPAAPAIRFAPGAEEPIELQASIAATVPIVAAGACASCHDLASPRDPVARCLLRGQESLAGERPTVCFDEHQAALPPDSTTGATLGRAELRPQTPERPDRVAATTGRARVCAAQHGDARPVAWEAAREAAVLLPVVPRAGGGRLVWAWLGAGLAAFGLAFGAARGIAALRDRRRRERNKKTVSESLIKPQTRVRLPTIDTTTCLGCYACVDACPYDVLEIQRYVAVVVRPDACCGLTLCEQRCPNGSLRISDGETIGDRPRLDDDLQSPDMPGLYLAGDVTGLPLIKNAILQGSLAVERIAADLGREGAWAGEGEEPLDLCIVGAGPAGISAALRAKEMGLSFEVIEQGSVAQSIQSFPRGKLVFDQPLDLPLTGKLWLKESTKEELLSHWMRIVRKEALPIRQDTRMRGLLRQDPARLFRVSIEPREGGPPSEIRARRVLLAIGQRGTPRRLPFELSPDVEARVHYHLADARSFEGKRVLVLGLGDVAMEAAVALARQPGTTVTIAHRGKSFSRGKARNVAEVERMRDAGRLTLRLEAAVTSIEREHAVLGTPAGPVRIPCDAVFVMIGSIPPWDVLRGAGVRPVMETQGVVDPSGSVFVQGSTASP